MSKDLRQLKEQATDAWHRGHYRSALESYLALEKRQPDDGQWSRRAAEMHRRLGQDSAAIEAFVRAVDKYVYSGFLPKARAACKVVLHMNAAHTGARERLDWIERRMGSGLMLKCHQLAG